jgi:hypothetical protein
MLRRQPVAAGNGRAALLAAAIALPIALVAGLISFNLLSRGATPATAASTPPSPGSTAPVSVPVAHLAPADAQACLSFIAELGDPWHGLRERHVTAAPEQNAAFGDPAITVQCGAPAAHVAATDEIFGLSGVCWYESSAPGATVWTTLDRKVPVAVTIPNHYDPPGQWANEFSGPLVSAMPSITTPYDC